MQSSTIEKIFRIFSNMKNMTQNIQNDVKRGSRIYRGYRRNQAGDFLPFHPIWGGGPLPPPRFGPNLYAKNVVDVFYFKFLNLILVFRHMPK